MDKVVHFEIPDMEYTMIQTTAVDKKHMPTEPGAINGGMMKRQDPVKSPVITIAVQDKVIL
ncbi:MAG: hypothetical protein Q7J35_11465 [Candidatus Methanoperedens sp.]|nr:hypothetical protein [Candidatus Methanoperedens sp.]